MELGQGAAARATLLQCIEQATALVPRPEHLIAAARIKLGCADELISEDSPAPEGEVEDVTLVSRALVAASTDVGKAAALENMLATLPASQSDRCDVNAEVMSAVHTTGAPVAPAATRPRFEWYQSPTHVFVSIFARGVSEATSHISVTQRNVVIHLIGDATYDMELFLYDAVQPDSFNVAFRASKVELRLTKLSATAAAWPRLEGTSAPLPPPPPAAAAAVLVPHTAGAAAPTLPYASKRDWSAIGRSLDEELKVDPATQNMEHLLQTIYGSANDDARRAMNKSFVSF